MTANAQRALPLEGLAGWRCLDIDSIDSTNRLALDLARDGDPGRLWVVAGEQRAGRGRRSRHWHSPPGNLYASLLMVYPQQPADIDTLPMVVSLSLYDAAIAASGVPADQLAIKWPNDLLLAGRKVSGILLEATSLENGQFALVIGMGVNCLHAPKEAAFPATSFADAGYKTTPKTCFNALAAALANHLLAWERPSGFAGLREQWIARASGLGEMITARFADGELTGRFQEVDERGRLVLKEKNGTLHKISAADVFFASRTQFGA